MASCLDFSEVKRVQRESSDRQQRQKESRSCAPLGAHVMEQSTPERRGGGGLLIGRSGG